MLGRIQQLMDGLRQVSSDIAHDLRTPLGRLRQHLEDARERATTTADYDAATDAAIEEADELLETFSALLRIAQVEAGAQKQRLRRRRPLRAGAQRRRGLPARRRGFRAHARLSRSRTASHLTGDRQLLAQMISNLVENALRHTPAGSTVSLALRRTAPGFEIEVADNGPGIPEAEREQGVRPLLPPRPQPLDRRQRPRPGAGQGDRRPARPHHPARGQEARPRRGARRLGAPLCRRATRNDHTTIVATSRARHTRRMKSPTRTSRPLFAYVGSYTTPERHGQGNGINVYRVDRRTGAFRHVQHLGGLENPSFLAINAAGTHLYSVHGDRSEANSFTIDPRHRPHRAAQSPVDRRLQSGASRLRCDRQRFLAICNYGIGFARRPAGRRRRQPAALPHSHHRHRAPWGRTASSSAPCACTISRSIARAASSTCRARARTSSSPIASTPGGACWSRPRAWPPAPAPHRAISTFHPRKALAYVINELNSTLTTYRQDRDERRARRRCRRFPPRRPTSPATAPAPRSGSIAPAATSMSPIAATTASACSPSIRPRARSTPRQWVPTHGSTPRFFAFDPAQRFLYVANQDGRSIVGYRVGRDGLLAPTRIRVKVGSPACIVFSHS